MAALTCRPGIARGVACPLGIGSLSNECALALTRMEKVVGGTGQDAV